MSKLKLKVEDLAVESFEPTDAQHLQRGTVNGFSGYNTCICPESMTCPGMSPGCPVTDGNHTCWDGDCPAATYGPQTLCNTLWYCPETQ